MSSEFTYTTLVISESKEIHNRCETISEDTGIKFIEVESIMDGLEHLMDFNVNSIIIDLGIGEDNLLKFLSYINEDYENKSTPIIVLSNIPEYSELSDKISKFNVISIMSNSNWYTHVAKLLSYIKLQQLNTFFIQNSLIESEGRGTIDQLTGAYNRYGCEDIFQRLTSRVKAYQEPFCAIMFDIDHFKSVNDNYGHDIGDEVLESISKIVLSSIRRVDSLVRLGGEEFIIFESNVNLDIAEKNAERMRVKFESQTHSSQNLNITASFGVVQYKSNEEKEAMIKRADKLLYIAKDSGRNKVLSENS